MAATDKVKRIVTLFCHALFCKGYSPTSISDVYNEKVAAGVKDFQQDAGLAETGIVSPAQMKAIFNTDSYVLSSKGDTRVREIQQAMNGQYNDYTGINPCDGIYSRATNNALIYAIQKEIGISVEDSAPSFGPTTFSKFPTLPFTGDSKEQGCNETMLTKILQYALYVNGYYSGYLGEEMNVAELVAGVRHHYDNGLNNISPFIAPSIAPSMIGRYSSGHSFSLWPTRWRCSLSERSTSGLKYRSTGSPQVLISWITTGRLGIVPLFSMLARYRHSIPTISASALRARRRAFRAAFTSAPKVSKPGQSSTFAI